MSATPTALVVDCPTCKRTIWANATCYHGQPPIYELQARNPLHDDVAKSHNDEDEGCGGKDKRKGRGYGY